MKQYPEIIGPNKAPREHCIAFNKYDGSNIRAEWSRKTGWSKFGSREVLIDSSSALGDAIPLLLDTYGESLVKIFREDKMFRNCQNVTVFCEYFGKNSFAGWHDPKDKKEIVLFDVSVHKQGFLSPREFIKMFKTVRIPEIVYEGNFNESFIQDVKDGKYPVKEGVVAKGLLPHGRPPHNLWMAKCKTRAWMERLKKAAEISPDKFKNELVDNRKEQNE
jgi:hypothetical protein